PTARIPQLPLLLLPASPFPAAAAPVHPFPGGNESGPAAPRGVGPESSSRRFLSPEPPAEPEFAWPARDEDSTAIRPLAEGTDCPAEELAGGCRPEPPVRRVDSPN